MIKIGHRGAAGYVAENSIASFKRAIELGVDVVEFDVRATGDGQLVVFHDPVIDRMTNKRGYLSNWTYEQLKSDVRIKGTGEPIPTLEEVCDVFAGTEIKLYVEIKVFGIERKVLKTLAAKFTKDRFVIGSFYYGVIRDIKGIDKEMQTIAIMDIVPLPINKIIKDTKCDCVSLKFNLVDKAIVEKCHKLSKKVFVWTLDKSEEIEKAKKLGVDGIVSNFPDRI